VFVVVVVVVISLDSVRKLLDTPSYIILTAVWYGCENSSFSLREECRLKMSENMVLKRFGHKMGVVTGRWRKLLSKELLNLVRHWSGCVRTLISRGQDGMLSLCSK
jgi:hypothetical protein